MAAPMERAVRWITAQPQSRMACEQILRRLMPAYRGCHHANLTSSYKQTLQIRRPLHNGCKTMGNPYFTKTFYTQPLSPLLLVSPFSFHVKQSTRTYMSMLNSRLHKGPGLSQPSRPWTVCFRSVTTDPQKYRKRTTLLYISALGVIMIGLTYISVPLYRIFCQSTGRGGQAIQGHDASKVETMQPVKERILNIRFNADTASSMQWNFRPQQTSIQVVPGETALAFYSARNPTDKPIIGISTYNIIPFEAGAYFNKIQCFCFEEQRLNPNEEVDLPVFFYIDPDFVHDPKLEKTDRITLSYTFFEAKEGLELPYPGYATVKPQPA